MTISTFSRITLTCVSALFLAACSSVQHGEEDLAAHPEFPQQPIDWAQRQSNDPAEEVILQRYRQAGELLKKMCFAPEYEEYFAKTPCLPTTPTKRQLSDTSRITSAQSDAARQAFAAIAKINEDTRRMMRESGLPRYTQAAQKVASLDTLVERLQTELLSGKITWGQYNRRRARLAQAMAGRLPKQK